MFFQTVRITTAGLAQTLLFSQSGGRDRQAGRVASHQNSALMITEVAVEHPLEHQRRRDDAGDHRHE